MYRNILKHWYLSMKIGYAVMYRDVAGRVSPATVTGVLGGGPSMNHAVTLDTTGETDVPHEADADGGACWNWTFPIDAEPAVPVAPSTVGAVEERYVCRLAKGGTGRRARFRSLGGHPQAGDAQPLQLVAQRRRGAGRGGRGQPSGGGRRGHGRGQRRRTVPPVVQERIWACEHAENGGSVHGTW